MVERACALFARVPAFSLSLCVGGGIGIGCTILAEGTVGDIPTRLEPVGTCTVAGSHASAQPLSDVVSCDDRGRSRSSGKVALA